MNYYESNGQSFELSEFETPFADVTIKREAEHQPLQFSGEQFYTEMESPFRQGFEPESTAQKHALAGDFVQLTGELNSQEFNNNLYQLAAELEAHFSSKISDETAMGVQYVPFVNQEAQQYFEPLIGETERALDRVSQYFSGNNLAGHSEAELEQFFSQLESPAGYTPAQEDFFKSVFNKVKSVVKKGVDLAKKGISVVGKLLPINLVLDKLKGMIRPLLQRVLQFAIGKLPKQLQPHAQNLAKRFLNLESENPENYDEATTGGELESIQTEFDNYIAQLAFAHDEGEAEQLASDYEHSSNDLSRESYESNTPSLEAARQQLVDDLKNLREGENATPAIERFIPVAIMALRPIIKTAISIIGRQKVINFLAGLLAKLVQKYVPREVVQPLAANIIDIGMTAIGFETYETGRPDVGYEAIANTLQETIQNMGSLNEELFSNEQALAAATLEAFETAAANNFPAQYIKKHLLPSGVQGIWILKPRKGPKKLYKKYTQVFTTTIEPKMARVIKTFGGVPLANFLRDSLGLDVTKPIQARVHLYESIPGTQLSHISNHEKKVTGLSVNYGYVQLHPLTICTAAILIKEPCLGSETPAAFTVNRNKIGVGQRFYYLEINGARLRVAPPAPKPAAKDPGKDKPRPLMPLEKPGDKPALSSDIQGVINFPKAEIRLNYFFSEEEAKTVVEKLNKSDYFGAAYSIRYSVRNVLNGILLNNVGTKVKIIHEAIPELYLENIQDKQEQFLAAAGKEAMGKIVGALIEKIAEAAYQGVVNYFKARAVEFKQAQAEQADGVTVKIIYVNVPGMSKIAAVINALRGTFSVGNLLDLTLPSIPSPEVQVKAGKNFD
ncbi:hypothetical protein A4H97_10665 [Niastella yeongjuensis]|uniref:Uncharacterized protein n=1 Tax=Niastella yeongjuensis TaxID=354355 RepID=A0A1V9EFW1_9BACT|nr:hypothetical protein [Niastella yeongjuensis]OQP44815.1 hypothetical protein A4H97_10665 [Niastella yeongjuensis]SEP42231.1 hypothetical protein SAMN05660816_05965 [Niastella yeongjuensis]